MENTITVQGKMDFMEKEIPVVSGGFGKDRKCVSDLTISQLHEQRLPKIRQLVNKNIDRFKDGVDIVDLKRVLSEYTLLEQLGYTKQSVSQAEHVYLFSERGYAKLIKIMDTDKAWDIYEELLDNYFHMRDEKEEQMKMETNETKQVDFTFGEAVAEIYALTGYDWDKTSEYVRAIVNRNQEDSSTASTAEKTHWSYTEIVKEKLTNVNKAQLLQILRDNGVINEIGSTAPKPEFVKKGWYEKVFLKTYYIGEEPYGERYDWRVTKKGLEEIMKMVEAHS